MDDCFKRQTVAASPAEPGASLVRLGKPLPIKPSERDLEGSRNLVGRRRFPFHRSPRYRTNSPAIGCPAGATRRFTPPKAINCAGGVKR